MSELSHIDKDGKAAMVDVGNKKVTTRIAIAQSTVQLTAEIIEQLVGDEIQTKKGPVFQTATIAGIMAVKKTSDLIPLCHPLSISKCDVKIVLDETVNAIITCTVKLDGKTGVEMEALTGASIAALTIYDMCKAMSHDIIIKETKLIEKTGGKNDFKRS